MPWDNTPAGEWLDLLASGTWTRLPIPLKATLSEQSPWKYDPGTGILHCAGDQAGHEWYRFDREWTNFDFRVEFRFTPVEIAGKRYNSGIFIRNSKDGAVWHQAQAGGGDGGYFFASTLVDGMPRRMNLQSEMLHGELVKPAGEWNLFEIRADHGKVTLVVNGTVSSIMDCSVPSGYAGLEAEGFPIEFRNVKLRPFGGK